jgi:hypothetical protein
VNGYTFHDLTGVWWKFLRWVLLFPELMISNSTIKKNGTKLFLHILPPQMSIPVQWAVKIIIATNILISYLIGKELQGFKSYNVSENVLRLTRLVNR